MLWIKSFHIIALVAWFSGLFYLPRLYVYHVKWPENNQHFKIMEKKLYHYIMSPAAVLTIVFGVMLLTNNLAYYQHAVWMHVKLTLVILLIFYHLYLGHLLRLFRENNNPHSERFYRWINEVPTVFLVAIVLLVVLKPTLH